MDCVMEALGHFGGVSQFISTLGLGAALGALVMLHIKRKHQIADRNFQEMREAYSGLLRTLTEQPAAPDDIAAAPGEFQYWVARVMLACPDESQEQIGRLQCEGRAAARGRRDGIILMMRHDLRQSN